MSLESFTPEVVDPQEKPRNYQIYQESQKRPNERQFQPLPSGKPGWSYAETSNDGHFGHHQGEYYVLTADWEMIEVREALKQLPTRVNHLIEVFEGFDPTTQNLSPTQALQLLVNSYHHPKGLRGPLQLQPKLPTSGEILSVQPDQELPEENGQKIFKKAKKKGLASVARPGETYEFMGEKQTLLRRRGDEISILLTDGTFEVIDPAVARTLSTLYQKGSLKKRPSKEEVDYLKAEVARNRQFEKKIRSLNPESWQFHFRWYHQVPYAPGPDWAVRTAGGNIFLYHSTQGYRKLNESTFLLEEVSESDVTQALKAQHKEARKNLEFDRYYEPAFAAAPGKWIHLGAQISRYYVFLAREERGVKTLYRRRINGYGPAQRSTEEAPGKWRH